MSGSHYHCLSENFIIVHFSIWCHIYYRLFPTSHSTNAYWWVFVNPVFKVRNKKQICVIQPKREYLVDRKERRKPDKCYKVGSPSEVCEHCAQESERSWISPHIEGSLKGSRHCQEGGFLLHLGLELFQEVWNTLDHKELLTEEPTAP